MAPRKFFRPDDFVSDRACWPQSASVVYIRSFVCASTWENARRTYRIAHRRELAAAWVSVTEINVIRRVHLYCYCNTVLRGCRQVDDPSERTHVIGTHVQARRKIPYGTAARHVRITRGTPLSCVRIPLCTRTVPYCMPFMHVCIGADPEHCVQSISVCACGSVSLAREHNRGHCATCARGDRSRRVYNVK